MDEVLGSMDDDCMRVLSHQWPQFLATDRDTKRSTGLQVEADEVSLG